MRLYNRFQKRICAKERKSISLVQRRKGRSKRVYLGADEEGIYKTIKITTDGTSILCGEEIWEEEDGAGLLVFK